MPISYVPYVMTIAGESTIYQNEVRCHVSENDFNYSLNPSAMNWMPSGSGYSTDGTVSPLLTGSDFLPYATTIGLFNDADDLLAIGKLATPYPIPRNTDITFVIRYDS
jgi:hypothetical protein